MSGFLISRRTIGSNWLDCCFACSEGGVIAAISHCIWHSLLLMKSNEGKLRQRCEQLAVLSVVSFPFDGNFVCVDCNYAKMRKTAHMLVS